MDYQGKRERKEKQLKQVKSEGNNTNLFSRLDENAGEEETERESTKKKGIPRKSTEESLLSSFRNSPSRIRKNKNHGCEKMKKRERRKRKKVHKNVV